MRASCRERRLGGMPRCSRPPGKRRRDAWPDAADRHGGVSTPPPSGEWRRLSSASKSCDAESGGDWNAALVSHGLPTPAYEDAVLTLIRARHLQQLQERSQ